MDKQTQVTSFNLRKIILEQSKRANVGHIGSALSIADIIAALYQNILNIKNPDDPSRDRFILSKGHAALALYAALHLKGWLSQEILNTYCADNSILGVHPEHSLKGVECSTGSLGQGLSMATGLALAAQLKQFSWRTFVLVSDAELNEGSVWEAVMFAAQHQLSNLVMIIDDNKQQALGYTQDVIGLQPLQEKLEAFRWDVHSIDGHNNDEIIETVDTCLRQKGKPHAIIANTTFGKGVSYMERKIKWHYWPMNEDEYAQALTEINRSS